MKITICNSGFFWKEAKEITDKLNSLNHKAIMHPLEVNFNGETMPIGDWYEKRKNDWDDECKKWKEKLMRNHFDHIMKSDAILVLNYNKNNIDNYIGGNTLMEMGLAFARNKKIFLYNSIPENLPYVEEIIGLKPIIINQDISKIE